MVTEEEITELITELTKTEEGRRLIEQMLGEDGSDTLSSDPVGVLADASSPTGGALGQISDLESEQLRAASPTGGALGQVSNSELGQLRAASPTGGELGQIGASPVNPGATRGMPPAQIGASPDIPGTTRGMLPGGSGIDADEANQRSMMVQELLRRRGQRY